MTPPAATLRPVKPAPTPPPPPTSTPPSSTPPEPSSTPPEPSSTPPEPASTPPEPASTPPETPPTPIPCPFTSPVWATHPEGALVKATVNHVTAYMANYDGSHDISHIQRVVSLARALHLTTAQSEPPRDPLVVLLAALMHDVGDKKYLEPGENGETAVRDWLMEHGKAEQDVADRVQKVCLGVSYSSEVKDPVKTARLVMQYPELAVVQDADRLDALGAVGIARCFAFGGAKGRNLQDSLDHFTEKLEKLSGMMKTNPGRNRAMLLGHTMSQFRQQFMMETVPLVNGDGTALEEDSWQMCPGKFSG